MTERLRFSMLKYMARSPLHMRHAMTTDAEPSRAMRIGTATHAALLGGSCIVYDGTRRGKAWDAFRDQHPGVEIVTADEHDVARAAADAVMEQAGHYFIGRGVNETRIDWDFCGIPFRSTPDRITEDGTLVELKTTRSSHPGEFLRDAHRRHYHSQLAVYREAIGRDRVRSCVIVAVETAAPYPVTVVELPERTLDAGLRAACGWAERYMVCRDSGDWPAYSSAPVQWDLEDEFELDLSGAEEIDE